MNNILIVVPSISKKWGGTTTSVVNFYKGMTQYSNISCTVLSTVTEDEKSDICDEILSTDDFILFPTKSSSWRYSKELNDYLDKQIKSFDLIWIHAIWTGTTFYASKYALKYNIPYVITPHGMIEPDALKRKGLKKKLYWSLIEKKIFNKASAIHCITEMESLYAQNLSKTRTFVIPNGIEEELFLDKQYDQLKSICFIGRFHEKKALDCLLKAIVSIKDVKLFVAGSGEEEYEKYIYRLVEELQIKDRVEFKGFANKDVKKEMFQKSIFLVLPSHTEGLSMVGLESIMNSTPVLTTSKCNFDDVEQYYAGMVMEDNSPETISEYILKMFDSNLEEMSRNAYDLAMEKFSINSVSDKIINEFDSIVQNY